MRRSIAFGIVSIIAFASPASASWWSVLSVGHDNDGPFAIYADRESIKGTSTLRKVWIERIRAEPSRAGDLYTKQLDEIDCLGARMRSLSFVAYGAAGQILDTGDDVGVWRHVPPDSTGEDEMKAVCHRFPQSSFAVDDPSVQGRALLQGKDPSGK